MILISFGTRPEYIKVKPLIAAIKGKIPFKTLFTGQHVNTIDEFIPTYRLDIVDGKNRLDSIVCSILNYDHIFTGIKYVMVQGDTTSAFAMALAAFHRGIKVIHLEAGLRTHDLQNPYPEEGNRQMISRIADIHFCPTELNAKALRAEGIENGIYVTGNTGLDNIDTILGDAKINYGAAVIVTLHRRENHDIIEKWFRVINEIAHQHRELTFIIPLHPNPNVQKCRSLLTNIEVIDPLTHDEMLKLVAGCRFVVSDSGGLQEECSYLDKKIIVCRKTTERPESLGMHSFLCPDPDFLMEMVERIDKDHAITAKCPYGDGHASLRIVEILKKHYAYNK